MRPREGLVVDRRTFLGTLAGGLLAAPLAAKTQPAGKIYRIGILGNVPLTAPEGARLWEAFIQGLRDLGYVEGRNLVIEYRSAEGRPERLPALAAELVALEVDVIVTPSTPAALAAKQATSTRPIVFIGAGEPVTRGSVTSLARPGGNVTGLSVLSTELVGGWLELLQQAVPGVRRVAALGSRVPWTNARKRTCSKEQNSRHGRWECSFNSLRREVPPISREPSRT